MAGCLPTWQCGDPVLVGDVFKSYLRQRLEELPPLCGKDARFINRHIPASDHPIHDECAKIVILIRNRERTWLKDPYIINATVHIKKAVGDHLQLCEAKREYMDNMDYWVFFYPSAWHRIIMTFIQTRMLIECSILKGHFRRAVDLIEWCEEYLDKKGAEDQIEYAGGWDYFVRCGQTFLEECPDLCETSQSNGEDTSAGSDLSDECPSVLECPPVTKCVPDSNRSRCRSLSGCRRSTKSRSPSTCRQPARCKSASNCKPQSDCPPMFNSISAFPVETADCRPPPSLPPSLACPIADSARPCIRDRSQSLATALERRSCECPCTIPLPPCPPETLPTSPPLLPSAPMDPGESMFTCIPGAQKLPLQSRRPLCHEAHLNLSPPHTCRRSECKTSRNYHKNLPGLLGIGMATTFAGVALGVALSIALR